MLLYLSCLQSIQLALIYLLPLSNTASILASTLSMLIFLVGGYVLHFRSVKTYIKFKELLIRSFQRYANICQLDQACKPYFLVVTIRFKQRIESRSYRKQLDSSALQKQTGTIPEQIVFIYYNILILFFRFNIRKL